MNFMPSCFLVETYIWFKVCLNNILKLCILEMYNSNEQPTSCTIHQWINSTVDVKLHTSSHQSKGHLSKRIRLIISVVTDAALVLQETATSGRKTLVEEVMRSKTQSAITTHLTRRFWHALTHSDQWPGAAS